MGDNASSVKLSQKVGYIYLLFTYQLLQHHVSMQESIFELNEAQNEMVIEIM